MLFINTMFVLLKKNKKTTKIISILVLAGGDVFEKNWE